MENKQEKKSFDIFAESKGFAIRSIKLYQYLTESKERKEYILSKQFLIAGTRIGDLLRQECHLEAYHSAKSAKYWLELLKAGGYLTDTEADSMLDDCLKLVKILYVISHPESRKDKATKTSANETVANTTAKETLVNTTAKEGGAL